MTQIIEYSKHSDHYLIHHFSFECNDNCAIGKFTGNCSLDKFMSLGDWQVILDYLSEPIEDYVKDPSRKLTAATRQINNTNFEVQVTWAELDASFYSRLLDFLDFGAVFPFVVKVKICLQSNIDKFPTQSPVCNGSVVRHHQTIEHSVDVVENGEHDESIKIKECFVRLPQLRFDENGKVIEGLSVSNKRKRESSIAELRHEPHRIDDPIEMFIGSISSTPFVSNGGGTMKQIKKDVRDTFGVKHKKTVKHLTNRLTITPRTSSDRKNGSFNPRIRLLKMPDDVNSSKKTKKTKKINKDKLKSSAAKRPKLKPQSIANESELFEVPTQPKKKAKKDITTASEKTSKKKSSPPPVVKVEEADIIEVKETDLKSLTEAELTETFGEHQDMMLNLFNNFLKQTNDSIQKSDDYNHFDMISLLSTDQFSYMLDILFDRFVKIGEFSGISYDALFLELLIPEWALHIFMKRHSLDRESAIRQISAQKSNQYQNHESYTTLLTTRIEESMNASKM